MTIVPNFQHRDSYSNDASMEANHSVISPECSELCMKLFGKGKSRLPVMTRLACIPVQVVVNGVASGCAHRKIRLKVGRRNLGVQIYLSRKTQKMDGEVKKRKSRDRRTKSVDVSEESERVQCEKATEPMENCPDLKNAATSTKHFTISIELDLVAWILFLVAFLTRTFRLSQPRDVVFDELHYGKYVSLYMKNTFFFDQHPPLGKQIIAAMASTVNYDGNYTFSKIGAPYTENVPIFWLRFIPALCGSLLSPLMYKLLLALGLNRWTALLGGILVIFDNALLTQSRFILMEPILLFFLTLGLVFLVKFHSTQLYSPLWFTYATAAAVAFTCAVAVKYAGFYSCCLAAISILRNIWKRLRDKNVSDWQLIVQTFTIAVIFTAIPATVYTGIFYVHLRTLHKAGPHDSVMTSAFQASLDGGLASIINKQPIVISHGSQVTIKPTFGRPCWLHSHPHTYPIKYPDKRGSSHQQQVTAYSWKDVNNWWIVKRPTKNDLVVGDEPDPIKHGDEIHLVHGLTARALNSHDVAAPVTPQAQEVSCYIDYNISMPGQLLWRVEIVNRDEEGDIWKAITSHVRLIHVSTGTALRLSGRQLPDWGFNQHEVVSDRVVIQPSTVWNVEEHRYTKTDDQKERERELVNREMIPLTRTNPSFLRKFTELQMKMLWYSDGLQANSHMYGSTPLEWLFLDKGIAYWVDSQSNGQIHLLGNIAIWYAGTFAVVTYLALLAFYLLRRRRLCFDLPDGDWEKFQMSGELLLGGYLINYLPFFFTERALFLHNYFPALIFKILLLCFIIEHLYILLKLFTKYSIFMHLARLVVFVWIGAVFYIFRKFAVLSYGAAKLSADDVINLRWKDTWDFILHKRTPPAFYKNDSDVNWVKNNYILEYGSFDEVPTDSLILEVINLFEETGSEIDLINETTHTDLLTNVKIEDNDITPEDQYSIEILDCNENDEQDDVIEDVRKQSPRTRRKIVKNEATGAHQTATTKEVVEVVVLAQTEKEVKDPPCDNKNTLICDICKIKCKSKQGMQLHMAVHTEKGQTSCKYCQEVIPTKYQLRLHMKEHHRDMMKKEKRERATIPCTFCQKSFSQPNQLRQHQMMHSDRKDIICDVCGKAFKRKNTLKQHMNVHTGEKPFKCQFPDCERAFRDRNSLIIHKRCHTDERPFPCEYCGKCFRDKGTLRIHYRQHTGENPYKCELCGKTTKQRQNLQSHMKHFHRINTNKN
uniref:Protein O-mannosyltransferase 1 n=1 Tax=Lutzomyia longipalpis TaxID=7200 RepID=A0A1B0CDS7_LUTLO